MNSKLSTKLIVKIVETNGIPKYSGFMDKTDQYVVAQLGSQTQKTSCKMNAGSHAVFNESLTFEYSGEPRLYLYLYDWDKMTKDDLVGTGAIPLKSHLLLGGGWTGEVTLTNDSGKNRGRITVSVEFYQRAGSNKLSSRELTRPIGV